MKAIVITILTSIFILTNIAFAESDVDNNIQNNNAIQIEPAQKESSVFTIDKTLKKEIQDSIVDIYGKENAEYIYNKFIEKVENSIKSRPKELLQQDKTRKSDWYKDEIIYMFYVDQFGTVHQDKENTFKDTALMLDYLQDLGVTTLYMLPFAESPFFLHSS